MVPLLLLIVAVSAGARAFAGEEKRGHLETSLTLPVGRRRVVVEGLAAMAAEVVVRGAATGRRAVATGAAAALALAAYLVDSLGALVPWLHDLGPFTPFHHYADPEPLRNGGSLPHLAALLALAVVGAVAAVAAVERRDIGT